MKITPCNFATKIATAIQRFHLLWNPIGVLKDKSKLILSQVHQKELQQTV